MDKPSPASSAQVFSLVRCPQNPPLLSLLTPPPPLSPLTFCLSSNLRRRSRCELPEPRPTWGFFLPHPFNETTPLGTPLLPPLLFFFFSLSPPPNENLVSCIRPMIHLYGFFLRRWGARCPPPTTTDNGSHPYLRHIPTSSSTPMCFRLLPPYSLLFYLFPDVTPFFLRIF